MSEQADKQQPEIAQLWRDWLTQSERQFSAFFNDLMGSEPFARSMSAYMEVFVAFQRMLADGMERYLTLMNMPSRTDVISLGETLRSMEGRLANIEEMFRIAAAVDGTEARAGSPGEPARTRLPPGVPAPERALQEGAVPEELRR